MAWHCLQVCSSQLPTPRYPSPLTHITPLLCSDDKGTIAQSSEYRFMLYRHWTLYDSMYYSNYVATKLGVWKQRGDFELLAVCCTLC